MSDEAASHAAGTGPTDEGFLTSSGYLLARIGADSRRRWVRMLADQDLAQHQFGVLMALDQLQSRSQRELSEDLGIDPRNAVAVLDGLERRSLIERRPDPSDRRRRAVRLTQTGRRLMERLRSSGAETETAMLSGLSDKERAELHRLLLKLMTNLA